MDNNFSAFLAHGAHWLKKTAAYPNQGLTDDDNEVPQAQQRTAAQKVIHLDLTLGQIAYYCPIISRSSIVKGSTSLAGIWNSIRQHFGFQRTETHFRDLALIKLGATEKPEDVPVNCSFL